MEIIPAILTDKVQELDDFLKKLRDGRKYPRVQIDFIDGIYANNKTVKPAECDLIPYLPLLYDAHLMVVEDNILNYTKTAQAVGFNRVIAQIEKIDNPEDFKCLAVDLDTDVTRIEKYLTKLELVLLMSVPAGFQNQKFDDRVLEKIKWLKERQIRVCVDGGVGKEHLDMLEKLGVDEVAIGVKRVLEW